MEQWLGRKSKGFWGVCGAKSRPGPLGAEVFGRTQVCSAPPPAKTSRKECCHSREIGRQHVFDEEHTRRTRRMHSMLGHGAPCAGKICILMPSQTTRDCNNPRKIDMHNRITFNFNKRIHITSALPRWEPGRTTGPELQKPAPDVRKKFPRISGAFERPLGISKRAPGGLLKVPGVL